MTDGEHAPPMRIGRVADLTGLSLRTLRHYDEIGLVSPSSHTEGGFRLYTALDVKRLLLIRRMKPLGYTLEQMQETLASVDRVSGAPIKPSHLAQIIADAQERRAALDQKVRMADEFLAALKEIAGEHHG